MEQTIQAIGGQAPIKMTSKDFEEGTFIIAKPGYYVLDEDVEMSPKTPFMNPPPDSYKYPKEDGYWLGFFASICVHVNDVVIDLNGHTLKMSREFNMRNRFFSHVELANKPFRTGEGPPQFKKLISELTPANRTVITNGHFGLSSHMGVHGNNNVGVWIDRLRVDNYEVGGLQFNGASNVYVTEVHLGPTMGAPGSVAKVPGSATFSQAQLLLRIANFQSFRTEQEFLDLRAFVEDYIDATLKNGGVTVPNRIFNNASLGFQGLPDGSALYGIVFHKSGEAVHEFAACASSEQQVTEVFKHFLISDVTVEDLKIKVDEVVAPFVPTENGGTMAVMGPAGDRVQIFRITTPDGQGYQKSPLTDAQEKIGLLRDIAMDEDPTLTDRELFDIYGLVEFPEPLMDWMAGKATLNKTLDEMEATFHCDEDAMGHSNKGIAAIRLEFLEDVQLKNVIVKGAENLGVRSEFRGRCPDGGGSEYVGGDVRAFAITNVKDLDGIEDIQVSGLKSTSGETFKVWSGCEAGSPHCPFAGANLHVDETFNPPNASTLITNGIFTPNLADVLVGGARKRRKLRKLRKLAVVV